MVIMLGFLSCCLEAYKLTKYNLSGLGGHLVHILVQSCKCHAGVQVKSGVFILREVRVGLEFGWIR